MTEQAFQPMPYGAGQPGQPGRPGDDDQARGYEAGQGPGTALTRAARHAGATPADADDPAGDLGEEDDEVYDIYGDEEEDQEPVPDGLVFTTAAKPKPKTEGPDTVTFELDGERMVAVRPVDDAFVLLTAAGARSMPSPEKTAAIINFLDECFDEPTAMRIRDRLLDHDDPFDFKDGLMPILEKLLRIWTNAKRGRSQRRRRPGRR